jgi:hypothetical protein
LRRSLIAIALGVLVAAALASTALAKEGGVELSSTPFGTPPGGTWNTTITVISDTGQFPPGVSPSIKVTNLGTGEQQIFRAQPAKVPTTKTTQSFVASVVFPEPGRYAYTVSDGVTDREYTYPPVRIVGAEPAVPVPSSGGGGAFPVWAPVAGGIALLLVAVGAAFFARRRRFGLSH